MTDVYTYKEWEADPLANDDKNSGGIPISNQYSNRMLEYRNTFTNGNPIEGMRWRPEWTEERDLTVEEMRGQGMLDYNNFGWDKQHGRRT